MLGWGGVGFGFFFCGIIECVVKNEVWDFVIDLNSVFRFEGLWLCLEFFRGNRDVRVFVLV